MNKKEKRFAKKNGIPTIFGSGAPSFRNFYDPETFYSYHVLALRGYIVYIPDPKTVLEKIKSAVVDEGPQSLEIFHESYCETIAIFQHNWVVR